MATAPDGIDGRLVSDNNLPREIRFTQAARRHRIGRVSVRHVMAGTRPAPITTTGGTDAWLYLGRDERGRELEIIAIEVWQTGTPCLLVIHVMPTEFRG
jgi:hypothetical protein